LNAQTLMPIGEVLRRTFAYYRAHTRLILIVAFPVVAFVDVVIGAGLGELTASVHKKLSHADGYVFFAADYLVTVPLVTAMLARAVVIDLQNEEQASTRQVVEQGFDLFVPALVVIILFVIGVLCGLILILPGIYLAVSWYFVVQAVAVDGYRGFRAVSASAAAVRGRWWHSAGVLLCLQLLAGVAGAIVATIFESLAKAANSDALVILGNVLIDTVALPFVAVGATLYYLELRERGGLPAVR
jgi:hypothetical protein